MHHHSGGIRQGLNGSGFRSGDKYFADVAQKGV